MISLKKALVGVAVTVAAVGVGVAGAAPAQAAGPANCGAGYFCNYRDAPYSVFMTPFQFNIPNYGAYGMHDNISGVFNNGNTNNARIYKNENYGGENLLIPRGQGDGNMHDAAGVVTVLGFADAIDSGRFV
ncbi:peptidase inhibitor family I36 protein [Leifsonia sp. SIMBA_070]|uniref:peptidase inhibitor family I36 protein n=1 Tax=Leifsonia sp. SIMBA_070 TaxID=3085810 RepID=UPI00397ADB65